MKHILIIIVGKQQFGRLQHSPLIISGILSWNLGLRGGSEKSSAVYMATSVEMVPSLNYVAQRRSASGAGDGHAPSLLRVFCLRELKDFCTKASCHQSMVRKTVTSCGYRDPAQVFKQTGCFALEGETWAASRCIITAEDPDRMGF